MGLNMKQEDFLLINDDCRNHLSKVNEQKNIQDELKDGQSPQSLSSIQNRQNYEQQRTKVRLRYNFFFNISI